ncbi:UvrD-helicase domain-containing protein [Dictyobacter aurantiacus]|uniref:DNA 3'-5' helicase n=1 Tax=Dictyobacter aurantiacus TaxID=1936993 RepID=A0A401ZBL6_9CHLR|nr:UvrD-helicase domain-containing protein [Dictyobacter aurantiacus]GCE04265.1 DNA helicase [Dictyobacter aurantiacus]
MDNVLRSTVEATARLVLEEYRKDNPAWTNDVTPVDDLAEWLGLSIGTFAEDDYAQGTYGFMDPDEEEDLIWICRSLNEAFRRFTLAHEIGHALLHCRDGMRLQRFAEQRGLPFVGHTSYAPIPEPSPAFPCHDDDIQEDMATLLEQEQIQEKIGSAHGYDPRSEREMAANVFAAELLMPATRLYTLFVEGGVPTHTLATHFHVSPAALLNRLTGFLDTPPTRETVQEPVAATPIEPANGTPPAKKRYDEFQQAAIEAETPALIVAGPGSGKTSTLIGRADYLINTLGTPAQNILALTFSRKATLEMEERLRQLLARSGQPLPTISTFHAFCANLLRQHAALAGLRPDFTLIDEAEGYLILRRQANAMRLHHYRLLQTPTHYFPDMLKAIARAKDELVTPEQYAILARTMRLQAGDDEKEQAEAEKTLEVAQVYALYQQELQRRGDTDYGGLLVSAIQLLTDHPEVLHEQQQRFAHILVDEFQDVNRASGVLLRVLAGESRRVWVVGDANQAIYGFRGASPANISQFEQDFPGARVLPLSRNYRSRPDLVALAEAFRCQHLEREQDAGKNQAVRLTSTEAYVTIAKAPDETSEVAGLIADIRHKRSLGYAYKDMIILCRTRSQANKITAALLEAELPAIEQGGILEQEYIKDALSAIQLIADNSGMGLLRMGCQPEYALSQQDVEALLLAAREPGKTPRQMLLSGEAPLSMSVEGRHALLRLSRMLQSLFRAPNMWSLLAQYLFIETSLVRALLARPDDKASILQLGAYQQLLQTARHYDQQLLLRQRLDQQTASQDGQEAADSEPMSLEEQVRDFLDYLRLLVRLRQDSGNRQNNEDETEEEADTISVMTVHASKGLEFPVVYMPGLMQRRFPTTGRSGQVKPPAGMLTTEGNSHDVGEACLFYVGVTRAKDQLVLSYSERYGKAQQRYQRSIYLDALEAGLSEERIVNLHWNQPYTGTLVEEEIVGVHSSQPGEDFIAAMSSPIVSTYAIESYLNCPRKYAYSSIYHFEDQPTGYRLFTQATRKTVESLHRQLDGASDSSELPSQQEIQQLYLQHWQELGGHTEPFATMYEEHGQEVVASIRRRLHTQEEVRWQLQPGYNVEVAGTNVHVPIDRVETANELTQQPDRFIRTSYGRSKEKIDPKHKDLLYHLAYRQQYPGQNVEVHSHNMSTGESMPITITARKEQSLYRDVEQAVKGLQEHRYPAQPRDPQQCPTCPFFFICPA